MNDSQTRVAFLDTNALLRMFFFWEACGLAGSRMEDINTWEELKANLESNLTELIGRFDQRNFSSIASGMACFRTINSAKEKYQFFSCYVCRAEMHRVILSAHAHERLNIQGVPVSLQRERPLVLHRRVLVDTDYEAIERQLHSFFEHLLLACNIDIKNIEDETQGDSVSVDVIFSVAQTIWSRIMSDTLDAYIYAAAIASQSDYFLTSDGPLRETANRLINPTDEWLEIADAVRATLGLPDDSPFPRGCNLNVTLP